jgi:hypothetical protein
MGVEWLEEPSPTGRLSRSVPPVQHVPGSLADRLQRIKEMGTDVHVLKAAEMFGVAPEDVTKAQRRAAKAVLFREYYTPKGAD